ncbi:hypothetical protein ONS95_009955 [Cadophora gregata]|uniref:uncharacterized protein n=1 Tax=Cadophora gregata TaxID=51156 RepID=UPI0026DC8720|nr:uncharacterized protein ONS95_009955 [Cadophora gregata]KAK0121670.1 hypothetical protein ONS95_009955 [Cadophora gregata]KAK0127147.1 hypothetical protein ONS96_006700 [Cadophora gregata f. sp. sojae]
MSADGEASLPSVRDHHSNNYLISETGTRPKQAFEAGFSPTFGGNVLHIGRGRSARARSDSIHAKRGEFQVPKTPSVLTSNTDNSIRVDDHPPRTSSLASPSAPAQLSGLLPSQRPTRYTPRSDQTTRTLSSRAVTPPNYDNVSVSLGTIDHELCRGSIGQVQKPPGSDWPECKSTEAFCEELSAQKAKFEGQLRAQKAFFEKQLEIQADYYEIREQEQTERHQKELQSIYQRGQFGADVGAVQRQAQYAIDQAKQASLSIIHANQRLEDELIRLRGEMSEMEQWAQRDKERYFADLASSEASVVSLKERLKSHQQLEERLGVAEQELLTQRETILRNQELKLELGDATNLLSAKSEACDRLEVGLRGYKSKIKRYENLWLNSILRFEEERGNLHQQIASLDRFIATFPHYQRLQSQNFQRNSLQQDQELVRLQRMLRVNIRNEIERARHRESDVRDRIETAEHNRDELQDQQISCEDDDEAPFETLENLQAELGRLYVEQKEAYGSTTQLQAQDQKLSSDITSLEINIWKSKKQISKPGATIPNDFKISRQDLEWLDAALAMAGCQSHYSVPELIQNTDINDIDEDEPPECHTPENLNQDYKLRGDLIRSSIASHISVKRKRNSSYHSPPKVFI